MTNSTGLNYQTIIRFVVLLGICFIGSVFANMARAQTMSNDQYILEQGDLNSFGGKSSSATHNINFSSQNFFSGEYEGDNYTVSTGFDYSETTEGTSETVIPVFTLALTKSSIDFGKITPGEPLVRTTTINIDTGDAPGFFVVAAENESLKNPQGQEIPDATCDKGNCTESIADLWNSPLTYGFGYRCDNIDGASCSSSFVNRLYFKQFANLENGENTQTIMQAQGSDTYSSQVTYKVNIPGSQAPGVYQNTIQYIALPTL